MSFLLNHCDRLKAYSILGLLHGEAVQSTYPQFSSSMVFDDKTAEETLVSLAFYHGYLTYKVTRDGKNNIISSTSLCSPNKIHYDHYLSKVPANEIEEFSKKVKEKTNRTIPIAWEHREELLRALKLFV